MVLVTPSPAATTLLHLMALLAPDPIPAALFMDERALAELERLGLISLQDNTVTVPPGVREAVWRRVPPDGLRDGLNVLLQSMNQLLPAHPSDPRSWEAWDLLRPHAEALLATENLDTAAAGLLAGQLAAFLCAKGLHGKAEPLIRRALAIDETVFGPGHPKVAIQLNNLGLVLLETNRFSEAEPLMRRALAIDEATLGGEHPEVAIDLGNLARLLQMTERLAEAEPLLRRALSIDEACFGNSHPSVGRDLNNLAQMLQDAGRPHEAEPLMRHAVEIFNRALGPDHPSTRGVRKNLELLLEELGYRHNW